MNEILGAIFGYNYRRRILINLRKKRRMLREKNLLKLKQRKAEIEKKKKQEIVNRQVEKEKEELVKEKLLEEQIEAILEDEEENIKEDLVANKEPVKEIKELKESSKKDIVQVVEKPKDEVIDLPKIVEDLNITKEELLLIEKLQDKYEIPSNHIKELIEEILTSIEIVNILKDKKEELTEEEKELVKEVKDDDLLEEIIQEDKKEILFLINDKTTSIDEIDADYDKYKQELEIILKDSKNDIAEITKAIEEGKLDIESKKTVVRGGVRKATRLLYVANILSRRRPVLNSVVRRMFNRSLIFDAVNPRKKTYLRREELLPDAELEAARKDIDYARLSIIDSKKAIDSYFYELEKYKDIEEYKESYDEIYKELEALLYDLLQSEYELDKLEAELTSNEEYDPEMEEELINDDDDLALFFMLRPRLRDIRRVLVRRFPHP